MQTAALKDLAQFLELWAPVAMQWMYFLTSQDTVPLKHSCLCVAGWCVALLWTAPELLRIERSERPSEGSFLGDVYSFGIIIYETSFLLKPYGQQLDSLGAPGLLHAAQCMRRYTTSTV